MILNRVHAKARACTKRRIHSKTSISLWTRFSSTTDVSAPRRAEGDATRERRRQQADALAEALSDVPSRRSKVGRPRADPVDQGLHQHTGPVDQVPERLDQTLGDDDDRPRQILRRQ